MFVFIRFTSFSKFVSVNFPNTPNPALFITKSIFSFLSSSYSSIHFSFVDISFSIISTFSPNSSFKFDSFSLFLPIAKTLYPSFTKYLDISRPIPEDAPVTNAFILSPPFAIHYTIFYMKITFFLDEFYYSLYNSFGC